MLNAGLRRKHPELFDGSRDKMLEVVPKGASGLGVDVKKGVSIPKGTVLGAYFGCLGTRLGNDDYTVEMPPVRHVGRTYRIDVSAAREARRGTDPVQAGLYNHACKSTTLRGEWFKCGPLSCLLFKARRRLTGGMQLTWNYDGGRKTGAFTLSRAEAAERPAARPCRCAGPDDRRFFFGAFSWRWATVRKIKQCLTVSALCSSPRASGYPAPTKAPGIPPIAALASHGARLQVTSSSNLRDVGPIKLAH